MISESFADTVMDRTWFPNGNEKKMNGYDCVMLMEIYVIVAVEAKQKPNQ